MHDDTSTVKVWDPVMRLCHWGIAVGFLVAYIGEDDALTVHLWAGYGVAALVGLRVLWGLVGAGHAHFRSFELSFSAAARNLREIAEFRARPQLGRGPAASMMAVALLLALGASVLSGWWVHTLSGGADDGAGQEATASAAVHPWDEVHEVIVQLTALLAVTHVIAVLVIGWQQRSDLPLSMVTGRRRRVRRDSVEGPL